MSRRLSPHLGLIAFAALAAAIVPGSAGAQAGIASEEECAKASSPEEELACLREALAASRRALAEANGVEPSPPPVPQPPQRELATAPAAPPPAAASTVDLGREQVARSALRDEIEASRPEALIASVTEVRTDLRGLLVMQLDNGQIWRQDESVGAPVRLTENRPVGVEITPSGFGGYRMRFPELGRRIVVSRLR